MTLAGHLKRRGFVGPAALLFCALGLGGGGPHAPILVAVIEALALLVLLHTLFFARPRALGRGGASGIAIILLLLFVAGVQLVPLPPNWWHGLPGRALLADTMALLGLTRAAWPISLSPDDTREAMLAFLPPIALFTATLRLDWADRAALVRLTIGMGVVSALLGFAQIGASDGSFFLYGLPPYDRAPGLFANFNHQATFLTAGMMLLVADGLAAPAERGWVRIVRAGLLVVLALGALVTSSRSGLALLALTLPFGLLLWLRQGGAGRRSLRSGRARLLVAVGAIVLVLLLVLLLSDSYRAERMAARFTQTSSDGRLSIWPNALYLIGLYFPVGAGFGTFDMVYQSAEPLNEVGTTLVNHAHNDYLELVIESGAAGAVLIALFLGWYIWRLGAAWRAPRREAGAAFARGASVALLFVLLHSLVDYPLRTEAIACLFAFCCALLVGPSGSGGRQQKLSTGLRDDQFSMS